ncbi:MAG TPA: cyclic nucleotide-binding domain-containing protein [Rhodocyclaceae bacterium]
MRLFPRKSLPKRLSRLQALSLFATLDARELGIVEGLLHEREFLAGEVIFDAGEEGQAIYIVQEGQVQICRPGQGENGLVAELGPGQFFGELALLDNASRALQARAGSVCKMSVMFRADLMNLLEVDAKVSSKIALQLARHLGRVVRAATAGAAMEVRL